MRDPVISSQSPEVDALTKTIQARTDKAMESMAPEEIATARKTGRLPYKVKKYLEAANER